MDQIYPNYKDEINSRSQRPLFETNSEKPKFNPNEGMESYDFNAVDKEMNPPEPKGPYPIGYDQKTKKTNPVAGPPNYNPMPEEPKGPFPISDKSIQQDKLNAKYDMLDRGINIAKTVGSLMPNVSKRARRLSTEDSFEIPENMLKGYGKSSGGDKEYQKPSVSVNPEQIQIPSRQVPIEDPFATSTADMKKPREYWFGKDESGKEVMFWRFFDGDKIRKTNAKRSEIDTKGRGVKMIEITNPIASR
jgi:hypothetical protein